MNILILNWRDIKHPLSGGAEISLFEHAQNWKKRGANVLWFSSSFKNLKHKEIINGIEIIRKGSHYTAHMWAFIYYLFGRFGKPDKVIDSFHFIPFFTPLYIYKKSKIIAIINEVAGKLWFKNIFLIAAYIGYKIEPFIIRIYKNIKFITGSNSTKKELIDIGIEEKDIFVIYHGVRIYNISNDIKKEKTPTIVFLGRISEDKGIKDALKAFVSIERELKDIKFWIIGKEEKNGIFNKLVGEILKDNENLKSKLLYFGFVEEKEKFELLKKAWVLVHPSYKEGWGLTVIEAASQETPTVGYEVEGLKDSIVNGRTGILTDPNPESLALSIKRMIINEELHYNLSMESYVWSKNFQWDKSCRKSWKVINLD